MGQPYYDELEITDPDRRETAHFARLAETLKRAKAAPGWARQLDGVEPNSVAGRAGLAKLPLLRKSELLRWPRSAAVTRNSAGFAWW